MNLYRPREEEGAISEKCFVEHGNKAFAQQDDSMKLEFEVLEDRETGEEQEPMASVSRPLAPPDRVSEIAKALFRRLGVSWLLRGSAQPSILALFGFVNGGASIGLMSVLAVITHSPFVFPSLGPTAFLFFYAPSTPAASPRNTILGHGIGVLAGYVSLAVTGLTLAPPALTTGVTWPRVVAAAVSLGLTAGLMALFDVPHPPAGSTTLIVSLGLLTRPWQLLVLMAAVVLLTCQAIVTNRLAGLTFPLWHPRNQATVNDMSGRKTAPRARSKSGAALWEPIDQELT